MLLVALGVSFIVLHQHWDEIIKFTILPSKKIYNTTRAWDIIGDGKVTYKLCSIYTAELVAIKAGLKSIEKTKNTTCTIYSDSKSSLLSLNQYNPKLQILKEK